MVADKNSNDYTLYSAHQQALAAKRLIVILRETIERQFSPNTVVDTAVLNVEVEVTGITSKLSRLIKET